MMEPRDVRHQKSSYREAFRQHRKEQNAETIKEWEDALKAVGLLKGWHVTKSDRQGVIIDEFFSTVSSYLLRDYKLVTGNLIGISSHVKKLKQLLQLDNEGKKVIGIHGMGGLGKTTIAKALCDDVCAQFDRHCFLEDVRKTLLMANGIVTLQNRIISTILLLDLKVQDASKGIKIINDMICKYKVLIILDDADDTFKFGEILGKLNLFREGSRFIITTRDKRVVDRLEHSELYELELMGEDSSLQLFSRHAFGLDCPPHDHVALSMKFVELAAGLPLALEVIGSLLFRRKITFWQDKLDELKDIPILEVQEKLKISYLALTHAEKQIFRDIACFFIGQDKEEPFCMWSACDFHPKIAITTLIQRSLIKINSKYERNVFTTQKETATNVFWMHDHVRDLGRTIVRDENFECSWERSRIWSKNDALHLLTHEEGSARLEGLEVENLEDKYLELNDGQCKKLSRLRYLKVKDVSLVGNFSTVLPNMRWLQLDYCRSIPIDLGMKLLVILHMASCSVSDHWIGWRSVKEAQELKSASIKYCHVLRMVPDLSQCRNLEVIIIQYCERMVGELHIGNLNNLKVLRIKGINLTALYGLGTGGATKLEIFEIVKAPNLINLDGLEHLILLKELILEDCTVVKKLPSLSNLTQLQNMDISFCPYLPEVHGDSEMGKPLSSLIIFGRQIPELELEECLMLMEPLLPFLSNLENLRSLKYKEIQLNPLLSPDGLLDFSGLRSLHDLYIIGCTWYTEIRGLESLELLVTLNIEDFTTLEKLSGLCGLKNLKTLLITRCQRLTKVVGIEKLESVECLKMCDCTSIRRLPDLSGLKHLKVFDTQGCTRLREVTGVRLAID